MEFKFTEGWTHLDSSAVKGMWYDADTSRLLVRLNGGRQYLYNNIARDEAAEVAEAPSVGRAYGYFRSHRSPNQSGSYAHDAVPTPRPVPVETATVVNQNFYTSSDFVPLSGGNMTSRFDVTYKVDSREFKSTVEAASLVSAAQDVAGKLHALGLPGRLTGVVEKV